MLTQRVKLGNGGLEVVDVESDECCHPVVGVDFQHAEHRYLKRFGPLIGVRDAEAQEDKALPADRDGAERHVVRKQLGDRVCIRHLGVSV
jgi:hypothetical protein